MSSEKPEEGSKRSTLRACRADQISALLWVIGGIVVILQTRELDYAGEYGVGAGFLPFWLGVCVIIFGVALFAKATFLTGKAEFVELPTRYAAWQIVLVFVGIFGLILLAERIGFIICIGLLFFFLLVFVERRDWKFALIFAFASPLVFWTIFEWALELRLPPGLLALF